MSLSASPPPSISRRVTKHCSCPFRTTIRFDGSGFRLLTGPFAKKVNVSALLKSAKYNYPVDMTNKKEIRDIIERLKEMQEKEEEEKKKNKRMRDDDENEDVIVAEDDAVVLDAAAGPILPPHLMNSGGKNDSKDDEEENPASSKKQKKETKAPIMGLSFGEEDE